MPFGVVPYVLNAAGQKLTVSKPIDMTNHFDVNVWFIENSQTGLLNTHQFMNELDF